MINWTELLISCVPFIIIIIIWIIIVKIFRKYNKTNFIDNHNKTIDILKEIRDELKELNKNNSQKQL